MIDKVVPDRIQLFFALVGCAITALGGCSSTAPLDADRASQVLAEHVPSWAGGEPSSVPPPHAQPQPLNIFDTPPARPVKTLDPTEQKKLQSDLVALRNRTVARAKAAQAVDSPSPTNLSADRPNGAEHATGRGVASRRGIDDATRPTGPS